MSNTVCRPWGKDAAESDDEGDDNGDDAAVGDGVPPDGGVVDVGLAEIVAAVVGMPDMGARRVGANDEGAPCFAALDAAVLAGANVAVLSVFRGAWFCLPFMMH